MKTVKKTVITLTEDQESEALAQYLLLLQRQGKIELYTHVPHETYTKYWSVKMRNKRMGVTSGFPDYIITTRYVILFIEMKRVRGGAVSQEQKAWIESLNGKRTAAIVAKGFTEAREYIDKQIT